MLTLAFSLKLTCIYSVLLQECFVEIPFTLNKKLFIQVYYKYTYSNIKTEAVYMMRTFYILYFIDLRKVYWSILGLYWKV